MARTERRRWHFDEQGAHLDPNGRDRKGQCWCCSGWKRPARRSERHDAKALLRQAPELVGPKAPRGFS